MARDGYSAGSGTLLAGLDAAGRGGNDRSAALHPR